MSSCQQAAQEGSGPPVSYHLHHLSFRSFIGYQTLIFYYHYIPRKLSLSCVEPETSIKALCCSSFPLSLNNYFWGPQKFKKQVIGRLENSLHHTRWWVLLYISTLHIYFTYLHIYFTYPASACSSSSLYPTHHNRDMRLLFLLHILIWHERLKTELQNLTVRKEVELSICTFHRLQKPEHTVWKECTFGKKKAFSQINTDPYQPGISFQHSNKS